MTTRWTQSLSPLRTRRTWRLRLARAAAGKHVLAEKPLGVTPSEAEAQIVACRDAGVKLGVLFNNRFRPEAQKMRQLIDEGAIGEIYRSEMSSAMLPHTGLLRPAGLARQVGRRGRRRAAESRHSRHRHVPVARGIAGNGVRHGVHAEARHRG